MLLHFIRLKRDRFVFFILSAIFILAPRSGWADDFFKGKVLTIVVSTEAGTGYDLYARTIGRHIASHIPGSPTVVIQNMAGAGGITATNYLYNVAPKDGLTIAMIQSTVPFEPFYGTKQATFDPLKFNWLGTPGQETSTVVVWGTVPVTSLQDAKQRGLRLAATGNASTPAFYARVFGTLLDIPIKLIVGYPSQEEIFLSMERGETEGSAGIFYSTLKANKADWLASKKVRVLLQYGSAPNPELPDVPFAGDIISKGPDKEMLDIADAPLALGRPMLAPPGVPTDRVATLTSALEQTFRDPQFLAECSTQRVACDQPLSGSKISDILRETYSAPAEIRERLTKIYSGDDQKH